MLPADVQQPAVTVEVGPVHRQVAVDLTVVLVQPPGPHQPEVAAGDEAAAPVQDGVLRLDRHPSRPVQHAHHRLPGRLAAGIEQRERAAQRRRTGPPGGADGRQLPPRAVPGPQRGVGQRHEVQDGEVARGGSRVSAAVATGRPRTRSTVGGSRSRRTASPRRCGCRPPRWTAANSGRGTSAGNHQPRSPAAVREVQTAESAARASTPAAGPRPCTGRRRAGRARSAASAVRAAPPAPARPLVHRRPRAPSDPVPTAICGRRAPPVPASARAHQVLRRDVGTREQRQRGRNRSAWKR